MIDRTDLVITESKVEPHDVHARVEHLAHLLGIVARWTKCADNGRFTLVQVDLLEDVLEPDAAGTLTDRLANHLSITALCLCVWQGECPSHSTFNLNKRSGPR